jgi:hypothetical protein
MELKNNNARCLADDLEQVKRDHHRKANPEHYKGVLYLDNKNNNEGTWFTVGDPFGIDATYIRELIKRRVIETSLCNFDITKIKKYVVDYDYFFCKEVLHHIANPYKAIYEMLRVARKGVVICEPLDGWINPNPLEKILLFIKKLMGLKVTYERTGNYVYKFSKREMEKVALGLDIKVKFFTYNKSKFHKWLPIRPTHLITIFEPKYD